jgi:tetratricopeptide (TPR) repeat protein
VVEFDEDGFPRPMPGVSRPDEPDMDGFNFISINSDSESIKILKKAISDEIDGNLEIAHKGFLSAREKASDEGEDELKRLCNCYLARSYFRMGDDQTAQTMLNVVLESFRNHSGGYPDSWVLAHLTHVDILFSREKYRLALHLLDRLLYSQIEDLTDYTSATILLRIGSAQLRLGNLQEGHLILSRATDFSGEHYMFHFSAVQMLCNSYIARANWDSEEGIADWNLVSGLSEGLVEICVDHLGESYPYERAIAMEIRAIYLYESGNIELARQKAQESMEWYERSGSPPDTKNLEHLIHKLGSEK